MKIPYIYLFAGILLTANVVYGETYLARESAKVYSNEALSFPEVGAVVDADIGESMTFMLNQKTTKGIKLIRPQSAVISALFFKTSININGGLLELTSKKDGALFYVSVAEEEIKEMIGAKIALRFPKDSTEAFQLCSFTNGDFYNCSQISPLIEGLDYSAAKIVSMSDFDFKRELSYAGGGKNSISILYREFKGNLARPAFTQEIKFDISEDNVIGFKGARFKIIQASNTGIKYTVIKHFND